MMVAAELEAAARWVTAGLGAPLEMLWGGLNWSGGSISLRILENHLINTRVNDQRLIDFVLPHVANRFQLPRVKVTLGDFKMADDAQQLANSINMMLQGYLDPETVWSNMGLDPGKIRERLEIHHKWTNNLTLIDTLKSGEIQNVMQTMATKNQILMQFEAQLLQETLEARAKRSKMTSLAEYAGKLREKGYATALEFENSSQLLQRLDPMMQQAIITNLQVSMPLTARLLMERLGLEQQGAMQQGAMQQGAMPAIAPAPAMPDMQGQQHGQQPGQQPGMPAEAPMPDQRPPRRDGGV
jgi:hypothetical protein